MPVARGLLRRLTAACAVGLSLIACTTGSPGATTRSAAPPEVSSEPASPSAAPTARPTPSGAAPAQLLGAWETDIPSGPEQGHITLTFTAHGVRFEHGTNVGTGPITVAGDEITFGASNLCDGRGTYLWNLVDDQLTFMSTGVRDPCGRVESLDGRTYRRVAAS